MPWKENTQVSLRLEFCHLASKPDRNFQQLCRQFQISPKTGYKWIRRYKESGKAGLIDRSRRPKHSPTKTSDPIEAIVISVREKHPAGEVRKFMPISPRKVRILFPIPIQLLGYLNVTGIFQKKRRNRLQRGSGLNTTLQMTVGRWTLKVTSLLIRGSVTL